MSEKEKNGVGRERKISSREILASEKWKDVAWDMGLVFDFDEDGTGDYTTNGYSHDIQWSVDGQTLLFEGSFLGEETTSELELVEENGFYLLQSENAKMVYARASDYQAALEIYKKR